MRPATTYRGLPVGPGTVNYPSGSFVRNVAVGDDYDPKVLICPSDGQKQRNVDGEVLGMGNYLAVNAPNTDQRDPGNRNVAGVFYYQMHGSSPDGSIIVEGATTLPGISDGTSNTVMVGERPSVPRPGRHRGAGRVAVRGLGVQRGGQRPRPAQHEAVVRHPEPAGRQLPRRAGSTSSPATPTTRATPTTTGASTPAAGTGCSATARCGS